MFSADIRWLFSTKKLELHYKVTGLAELRHQKWGKPYLQCGAKIRVGPFNFFFLAGAQLALAPLNSWIFENYEIKPTDF